MFPIIKALDVYEPCLPLKNDTLNSFWRHTLQAYKSFCCKVSPVKAEEHETEPLFYNDNIKVENKTEDGRCIKSIFVALPIFYTYVSTNETHTLNTTHRSLSLHTHTHTHTQILEHFLMILHTVYKS